MGIKDIFTPKLPFTTKIPTKADLMEGIERVLNDNEAVIDSVTGLGDGKIIGIDTRVNGILVLTHKRLFFYYLRKKGYGTEEYSLDKISSINFTLGKGLLAAYGIIEIFSNNNVLKVFSNQKHEEIEAFVKSVKQHIEDYKKESTPVSQAANIDIADQIKKLADLKAQGFLTEEEFTTHKKKLLGL